MKIANKLLPLTTLAAVATVPVVATSCSKTWLDMYSKEYKPSFDPLSETETTNSDATEAWFSHFKQHQDHLIPDCYWGASKFARDMLTKVYDCTVDQYLMYVYSFKIDDSDGKNRLSYTFQTQLQTRSNTEESSFEVTTYDLYWEISGLEFSVINSGSLEDGTQLWTLCPTKFDYERKVWFQDFVGNERIKFDFKTVIKGYSNTGAQNFIREINESAVIDDEHKYVPKLNEVFTDALLYDSYYLSKQKPRMKINETTVASTSLTGSLQFDFGKETINKFNGKTVTLTLKDKPYVVSRTDFKVKDIKFDPITVSNTTQTSTFTIEQDPSSTKPPVLGDQVYFTVHAECEDWNEDFYINTLFFE